VLVERGAELEPELAGAEEVESPAAVELPGVSLAEPEAVVTRAEKASHW